MFFTGTGTALPSNRFTQAACWEAFSEADFFSALDRSGQALLRKVLQGDNGITSRHLAVETLAEGFTQDPDTLHQRFLTHAPALASRAATEALGDAGLGPKEIDALVISTCTGYLCPGLSSYVLEELGLNPSTLCLDLVGQGCGAALPNLQAAEALVASGRARHVLSVCVEVCSAAFYIDNDPGVLISACLFGDGAAAAIVSRDAPEDRRCVEWLASTSRTLPEWRDTLRFEQQDGMLRNILRPEVPEIAARVAGEVFEELQQSTGVGAAEIDAWLWHAGGRNVLQALAGRFDLRPEQIEISSSLLQRIGNVSSPFVLFALDEALRRSTPDGHWWMASFGAGFSSHGALLKVTTS